MSLEQIFFLSQSVAAIGVMASLVFVGFEIRNNARAASVKGFADLGSLTADEKTQFVCTYMAFLSHSQNAFHQWREGHLASGLWACWEALMMNLVNTPGGAAFWAERSYVFDEAFRDEVTVIMKREPNPVARALGVVPVRHRTSTGPAAGAG